MAPNGEAARVCGPMKKMVRGGILALSSGRGERDPQASLSAVESRDKPDGGAAYAQTKTSDSARGHDLRCDAKTFVA